MHPDTVAQLLEFQTGLQLQEAANKELLREIADLKLKHDYQVRRADLSEKRVFELLEELKDVASENAELRDELGLIKHILVEVGNGRFQKMDKPSPNSAAFIPSLPEGSAPTRPNAGPMPYYNGLKPPVEFEVKEPAPAGPSPMSSDRDVIWPKQNDGQWG